MPKKVLTEKVARLSCIMLCVVILILPFNIVSFASDNENLINPNLTAWDKLYIDGVQVGNVSVFYDFSLYRLYFTRLPIGNGDFGVRGGAIYDLTDLNAGNSYTLSFFLPNYEQINELSNGQTNLNANSYYQGFNDWDGTLFIGLADSADFTFYEDFSFTITKDNYSNYFGNTNKLTFEMPNIQNPCIVIYYADVTESGSNYALYFSDFSLIDNDALKEDNFLSRLFAWFQEKFDIISDNFSHLGNKIIELKDGFVDKINELKNSFVNSVSNLGNLIGSFFDNQLEGIKNFFRGFGNLILYFNWDGDYTNPFENTNISVGNGADNYEHLILAVDEFTNSVDNLTHYLGVPSKMLKTLGEEMPIIPIIVLFSLIGLVVMRLFGVRRDS